MDLFKLTKSKTREKILRLFFSNPSKKYYLRELERIVNVSVGNIRRELLSLEKKGIFESKKVGNLLYYHLNKEHPLYKEIKKIVFKSIGVEGRMRQAIKSLRNIDNAFIYGSFAKDAEDSFSDIDLFVIGNPDSDRLLDIINKLEKEFQREINYTVVSGQEFSEKKKNNNDYFLKNILKDKKIVLI